jgi:hypothetical protein
MEHGISTTPSNAARTHTRTGTGLAARYRSVSPGLAQRPASAYCRPRSFGVRAVVTVGLSAESPLGGGVVSCRLIEYLTTQESRAQVGQRGEGEMGGNGSSKRRRGGGAIDRPLLIRPTADCGEGNVRREEDGKRSREEKTVRGEEGDGQTSHFLCRLGHGLVLSVPVQSIHRYGTSTPRTKPAHS